MNTNTFSIAGVSTLNGVIKVRFANDLAERIKVLTKNDHTSIVLVDLGTELTKTECAKVLLAHKDFTEEAAQTVIAAYLAKNTVTGGAPKVKKAASPKTAKAKEHTTPPHKTKEGTQRATKVAVANAKAEEEFKV
tara:strand:+ start:605 stop:1009 length:405 start_codon:yes stop_codon:yes gene_type:complete